MILNGWKQIAEYLGRSVRSIQRWESLGMPIRRPKHKNRSSAVVALSEELDAWLKTDFKATPVALPVNAPSGSFKRRILIADDDEALLVTTAAILIKEGYEVRTARDGFETLAALRIGLPDILITDLKMPNMSGFELLAIVRRRFPAIGVIAMSGEFTPANKPSILADYYVEKGLNSAFELTAAIQELVSQIPLRSQPAKPDSAPAWIPRSLNGYIVLTCLECLRSFSIATRQIAINAVASEPCIHCGQSVTYCIDETVLPIAAEGPDLASRLRRATKESLITIERTKELLRNSKLVS